MVVIVLECRLVDERHVAEGLSVDGFPNHGWSGTGVEFNFDLSEVTAIRHLDDSKEGTVALSCLLYAAEYGVVVDLACHRRRSQLLLSLIVVAAGWFCCLL